MNVEEIKEVVDLSKEEKKISLTKLLAILGILGTSLAAVLVIGWTVKKNFGFSKFLGQVEVKSVGESREKNKGDEKSSKGGTNPEIREIRNKSSIEGIQKEGRLLTVENATTSNSTVNTSSNKTSIGQERNETSEVRPKADIQGGEERGKEPTERSSKRNSENTEVGKER